MKVLVACEESQRVCIEFRKKGHEAYSCDIIEQSGGFPEWHIKTNVLPLLNGNCTFETEDGIHHKIEGRWDLIIAFPPCTNLCNAGLNWFTRGYKDYKLQREAIAFFYRFVMADCDKIAIENPVGIMSTCYKKPSQIIQPYWFGDKAQKSTCLWLKNLPLLKATNIVDKGAFITYESGRTMQKWYNDARNNPNRSKIRSKTFLGIAQAMAEQWG